MKSSLPILAAVAIPLLLSTPPASAGEALFNVPVTDRARQVEELLSRAANALDVEVSAGAGRDADLRLSNLWIYPTNEVDTVFAHYTLTANDHSSAGLSSAQHLVILTLRGNRIVTLQDLTDGSAENERSDDAVAGVPSDGGNWSAKIGTGHSSSSIDLALPRVQGVPASPHWSASIGTGRAADAANELPRGPAEVAHASVLASTAVAHWTSKIGTGRVSGSNVETTKKRIQS